MSPGDETPPPPAAISIEPRRSGAASRATLDDSTRALGRPVRPIRPIRAPVDAARDAQGPLAAQTASRSYAQAVSEYIDSKEFKDTVGPLARLYFAFFGRYPDQDGLDWYVDHRTGGRSLGSIADEFAGSPEFQMRYGELGNAAFIDRVFENVFGVAPDAAQRAYWIDQLASGVTRGQVMLAFSEGADFRRLTANEVFVATAYAETLQRTPDPAGFARWVAFLDAGNSRDAVIEGLLRNK